MRRIENIVIHCSASPDGQSLFRNGRTPVEEIDAWHAERGFAREDDWRAVLNPDLTAIGYHIVIYTNGAVATGRHFDEIGAHVRGYNQRSLGLCLIGSDRFTPAQWHTLAKVVELLKIRYPEAAVRGHRDFPEVHKLCPGFDVAAWLAADMTPAPEHVLETEATHA